MNDFTYGEMGYASEPQPSLLSIPGATDLAVESYSLSKAYSVPGWRVAALLGNSSIINALTRLKSWVDYGIFLPIQRAATYALISDQQIALHTTSIYKKRAQVLQQGLEQLGWQVQTPQAGAALLAKPPDRMVKEFSGYDTFASVLLDRFGIFVLPGSFFSIKDPHWVRFALVQNEQHIREALMMLGLGQNQQGNLGDAHVQNKECRL